MLSKYSPIKNKIKVITAEDIPRRKHAYIKDNFGFLDLEETTQFNDNELRLESALKNS